MFFRDDIPPCPLLSLKFWQPRFLLSQPTSGALYNEEDFVIMTTTEKEKYKCLLPSLSSGDGVSVAICVKIVYFRYSILPWSMPDSFTYKSYPHLMSINSPILNLCKQLGSSCLYRHTFGFPRGLTRSITQETKCVPFTDWGCDVNVNVCYGGHRKWWRDDKWPQQWS